MNAFRRDQIVFISLIAILAITLIIYWPGLYGRFLLDDFAHIVTNKRLEQLKTFDDLIRLIASGYAGPGGRPIALLTFAPQVLSTGKDPFYFKLVNLAIHLINSFLVFFLVKSILQKNNQNFKSSSSTTHWFLAFPLICVAWWSLNPVGITGVLYIVQRMTSLSTLFSLAGLILYLHFRYRAITKTNGNLVAAVSLLTFTALSYYTKEIGILTLGYAYLLEVFILKWQGFPGTKFLRPSRLTLIFFFAGLITAAGYLYLHPIQEGYANRPFTLQERLLTQGRVMWFYIVQILLPKSTSLSLYHDDFLLSRHLLEPPSTLVAIIGHAAALLIAFYLRSKTPLLSLGIFWFYLGHSLESTVFPLELVYEHRNYMPMMGLLLGASSIPFYLPELFKRHPSIYMVYGALIVGCAVITGGRVAAWGNPSYSLLEAERKPMSARANFDAGLTIKDLIETNPELIPKYAEDAKRYYSLGIDASESTASPSSMASYTGMFALHVFLKERVPENLINAIETKLRNGPIHPVISLNLIKIHELLYPENPYFTGDDAERIYKAVIANPRANGYVASNAMIAYGLLWESRGDHQKKLIYLKSAVEMSPDLHEARIMLIADLINKGDLPLAKMHLQILRDLDKYQYFKKQADSLEKALVKHNR